MSNKKNKQLFGNQQSISKFFNKPETHPQRKRTVETNTCFETLSPSNKVPKLQSSEIYESEPTCKYQLSESTITRIQSYSSNSNAKTNKTFEKIDSETSPAVDLQTGINTTYEKEPTNVENKSQKESSNSKYTPLEKQYLDFKHKYADAILLIQCGYKYKFFGEDAEIASKVLNIACFKSHNFMSAIIPVQRMHFHVRRLVLKGYKVGVIKQTETTALKAAGDKKNELFSRELYALYTKATLIGEEFQTPECDEDLHNKEIYDTDLDSNYLACVSEVQMKDKKGYNIAIVGVQLTSGDLMYSSFDDNSALRNKLESCLYDLNPSEILIPSLLCKETESLINGYSFERSARVERLDLQNFDYSTALDKLSRFYAEVDTSQESSKSQDIMQKILTFPSTVVLCLSALVEYLSNFKLENILTNVICMKLLSTNESMILTAATLRGLEILRNNSTHTEKGSLFWVLNRTSTKFGQRLLKSWIVKPLKDLEKIEERLDILTEVIHSESIIFKVIEKILNKLPDLERVLCSVFYQKCCCYDFVKLAEALTKIQSEILSVTDKIQAELQSSRIKNILSDIPILLGDVEKYLSNLDPEAAKLEDKTKVFRDLTMFPDLLKCKNTISNLEKKLNDLRPEICKTLRLFNMKYITVSGQKYLIEVPNGCISLVPKEWLKVSSTKQVSRYRSPEVIEYCKEIDQQNELMIGYANEAWCNYLNDFGKNFHKFKRAISHLAELDCYLCLARISKEEEFCRPQVLDSEDRMFHIVQGRHPVTAKLIDGKQFVANDINMNITSNCVIVTGPNMGGKSTYVRQTALIALLAHIGSYVPAESATVPLFDNIYVRMGADDDLFNRKSTFMVEMCEASEILSCVTSKSFAVLDELGRGTSTNDGTAVAYAALEYLVLDIKCFTLFVTHYPEILELKDRFPNKVSTVTMAYILKDKNDDSDIETVTFLYNVIDGISEKSYGINVAALAGIPRDILNKAYTISQNKGIKIEIMRHLKNLVMKVKLSTEENISLSS